MAGAPRTRARKRVRGAVAPDVRPLDRGGDRPVHRPGRTMDEQGRRVDLAANARLRRASVATVARARGLGPGAHRAGARFTGLEPHPLERDGRRSVRPVARRRRPPPRSPTASRTTSGTGSRSRSRSSPTPRWNWAHGCATPPALRSGRPRRARARQLRTVQGTRGTGVLGSVPVALRDPDAFTADAWLRLRLGTLFRGALPRLDLTLEAAHVARRNTPVHLSASTGQLGAVLRRSRPSSWCSGCGRASEAAPYVWKVTEIQRAWSSADTVEASARGLLPRTGLRRQSTARGAGTTGGEPTMRNAVRSLVVCLVVLGASTALAQERGPNETGPRGPRVGKGGYVSGPGGLGGFSVTLDGGGAIGSRGTSSALPCSRG